MCHGTRCIFLSGKVPTDVPIHVCRNLYFDKPQRFEIYHTSNAREPIEKNGITLDFPAVGTCVADLFYFKRMPNHGARPKKLRNTRGITALADSPRENM